MRVDLHHFVDGIAALPPAVHLLIQQAEPGIRFTFSKAPQQGAKVYQAAEKLQMMQYTSLHSVVKQALNQTDRLKKVAMLDRIIDPSKTQLEELMAGMPKSDVP